MNVREEHVNSQTSISTATKLDGEKSYPAALQVPQSICEGSKKLRYHYLISLQKSDC
jgi:hypothetical protein